MVGATENLPSGRSVKPGDIVRAANGKTIEVNNTDAEGRLVLADCLCHAVGEGAERIVDLATLTGAVIVALGSTYAGLMSNDEELAERIAGRGRAHGRDRLAPAAARGVRRADQGYATATSTTHPKRARPARSWARASCRTSSDEVPWAHLDIAGSAWDLGRAYVGKGASGYGVRAARCELAQARQVLLHAEMPR